MGYGYISHQVNNRNLPRRWLLVIGITLLTAYTAIRITTNEYISVKCGDYFRRAARASDVETAGRELDRAVQYLERRGLTAGYTSVFWRSPDEDIGFWYRNVKTMQRELHAVGPTASQATRSVVLIRFKDAVLKDNNVISPDGIDIYPYNTWLAGLFILGLLLSVSMAAWWVRDNLRS